ncbi:MAG: hypothetical protein WC710_13590 [Gallionella sp.]|jgi:hypothetical protein
MGLLILLRYGLYGLIACVLAYGGGYWRGKLVERDRAEQAQAAADLQQFKVVEKVVTKYVQKIERVNVPGPVIYRNLANRLCDPADVHRPGSPDAAQPPDSADARTVYREQFAEEIRACVLNTDQLDSLKEAIRKP